MSGPSFLGLSDDDAGDDGDTRDSDDLYKANWGGRLAVVFVILAVAGGLAYLQWRSVHPLQAASSARPAASQPSAAQPAASGAPAADKGEDSTAAPASNSATSQPDGGKSSAPARPTHENSADGKSPEPPTANAAGTGGNSASAPNPTSNSPKSTGAAPPSPANQAQEPPQSGTPDKPDKTGAAKSASSADAIREGHEVVTGKSADDMEEPVRLAETYLQGRGVPRNCPAALGILRSASDRGNPRAEIKLGALYATGNCVAPDRVAAYRYFSRAMQAQPNNTWLDQSRSMLWSNMNDSERKQAMEVEK